MRMKKAIGFAGLILIAAMAGNAEAGDGNGGFRPIGTQKPLPRPHSNDPKWYDNCTSNDDGSISCDYCHEDTMSSNCGRYTWTPKYPEDYPN